MTLTSNDNPMKKPAVRAGMLAWLVVCWLLVAYPYGLLLFILSAAGHRALQRAHQIRHGNIETGPAKIVR